MEGPTLWWWKVRRAREKAEQIWGPGAAGQQGGRSHPGPGRGGQRSTGRRGSGPVRSVRSAQSELRDHRSPGLLPGR